MADKKSSASKIKMERFDDLFGIGSEDKDYKDKIVMIPLEQLYDFSGHPFKVLDDGKMEETVESIRQYGVLNPALARPRREGGYELISGHRRKRGSFLAGLEEMPVIVREYTDDEAAIIMVDANIQREDILPSEKAKAYKMKYEAMKHQGKKSGMNTLDMVDKKKLGFSQGVDISFLSEVAQQWVQVILEERGCNVSTMQSGKLKEYDKNGELTFAMVRLILTEEKIKARKVTLKPDKISKYFEEDYSSEEIEKIIIQLLDEWKNRQ